MVNKISKHIPGKSANLPGFCLFVIISLHLTNRTENNLIDEFTSIVAFMLTASYVFSFITLRTNNEKREAWYEQIANYFFIVSIIGIFAILPLSFLTFGIINYG